MITITRKFTFDSAHRVLLHESKCKFLHGHTYLLEITITAPELDALGRVLDFGVVKQLIGGWIDTNFDHGAILNAKDPLLHGVLDDDKVYVMQCNPTAENIAKEIFVKCHPLLPTGMTITNVRVWETPNCCADFKPDL